MISYRVHNRPFLWRKAHQRSEPFQASWCVSLSAGQLTFSRISWKFSLFSPPVSAVPPFWWTWVHETLLHLHLRKSIIRLEIIFQCLPHVWRSTAWQGKKQCVGFLNCQHYIFIVLCCKYDYSCFHILSPILSKLLVLRNVFFQLRCFSSGQLRRERLFQNMSHVGPDKVLFLLQLPFWKVFLFPAERLCFDRLVLGGHWHHCLYYFFHLASGLHFSDALCDLWIWNFKLLTMTIPP